MSTTQSEPESARATIPQQPQLSRWHRNFAVIATYQVLVRLGWIFKTESIIIPAVLDSIGGAAWLRGFLPLLNRFGQSVPPIVAANTLSRLPRKRYALALCTTGMALSIFLLGALVTSNSTNWWKPIAFLTLYATFFACTGVNQLTFGTLQGKLIPVDVRGRLMMVANVAGATVAILAAWLLMPIWLKSEPPQFRYLFYFAGLCFAGAVTVSYLLSEHRDQHQGTSGGPGRQFSQAWQVATRDPQFRPLAITAMLFGSSLILFPHYQALARDRLHLGSLTTWVIVQNLGTGIFSLVLGPLADWKGNRAVLRFTMLGLGLMPLLAVALSHYPAVGRHVFGFVFVMIGLTPVTFRVFGNFTLEVCSRQDHARYLSTLGLCIALPITLSPLAGLLIDVFGFELVFCCVSTAVLSGWLLTWLMPEPRHAGPTIPD